MSIRKSVVNDINVLLEPVYLKSQQGNGTLLSFDVDGKVIDSEITTQSVADFINDPNSAIIASTLTGFDYVGKIGYITASDTLLSALEKSQYQIDDIIFSKGANSGIATLDSSGKLTYTQIPASLIGGMIYQGTWNADTNTPELTSSTGTKGFYYIVSVSGTTSIDGISVWTANDWIVFDGAGWDKIDNSTVNVLQTPLTGYVVGSNTAISSTNTILAAFGYIQGQLNNKSNISNGTQNYLPYFSTSDTISSSTIYHSPTSNNGGSSTIINSNNTSTESLTVNDYSSNKLLGIRNDARFIFKASTLQINDINNTESSAIYIGSGDNVYSTHLYIASRETGSNDFISFYNTGVLLKTFWYDYNSVLNVKSVDNSNSTSLFKLFKSDGTQISNFTNDGLVFGTATKDVSSIIDMQTISKGLGLPNLLTSQKTAITTNRKGLTVYDDTLKALSFWNGTSWSSTINNTSSGVTYAIPYYSSPSVLTNSTLYYGETDLLKLTDADNTDKNLFVINSFGSTNNFVVSHNYTSDLTSISYDNLDTITANLSDGLVQIGGLQHMNSISSAAPHIVLTDSVTSIDVFKIYSTGNSVLRTTDNTATNKFFTFTNFGGTQIGYIENGGMVIGSSTRNVNLTLDLQSTTMSVGLPLLSTTTENGISATVRQGMVHYNTTSNTLRISDGTVWNSVLTGGGLTNTYIPYYNGTVLVNSPLSTDGTHITLPLTSILKFITDVGGGSANLKVLAQVNGVAFITSSQEYTAYGNLFMGKRAGNITSNSVSFNTSFGDNTLPSINTSYNSAFGSNAGLSSSSAQWISIFGAKASFSNTTGSRLAIFGMQASFSNNGSDNVVIGSRALFNATNVSNCIIIGSGAAPSETSSHKLHIEGASNAIPLIGGDFSSKYVAINGSIVAGTTSPNAYAIIQADSTTKGLLPPRMTTALKLLIGGGTPPTGLEVFDTDLNAPQYYNGTSWVTVGDNNVVIETWDGSATYTTVNTTCKTLIVICTGTITVANRSLIISNAGNVGQQVYIVMSNITGVGYVGVTVGSTVNASASFTIYTPYQTVLLTAKTTNGSWVSTIPQFTETSTDLTATKIVRSPTLGTSALLGRTPTLPNDGDFQFAQLSGVSGSGQGMIYNGYASGNQYIPAMDITNGWTWFASVNSNGNYMCYYDGQPFRSGNVPNLHIQLNGGLYCFRCMKDVSGESIEGYFSVSSGGIPSNLVFTKPSSNTSDFNVAIVSVTGQNQIKITSVTRYVVTKVWAMGSLVTPTQSPYMLEKWSSDAQTKFWTGTGGLGIGHTSQDASAILQVDSTSKGFLPPRMTSTQRTNIPVSASTYGLLVYQTDGTEGYYLYKSTGWTLLASIGNNVRQVDVQLFNYALQQDVSYVDAGTITTFINLNNQLESATYQKFTYSAGTWTSGSVTTITFTAGVSTVSIAMAQYDFIRVVGVLAGANTQAVLSIKTTIS
jgi:hypothetical protein